MDGGPNQRRRVVPGVPTGVAVAVIGLVVTTALALPGRVAVGETAVFRWGQDLPRGVGLPLEGVMQVGTFVAAMVLAVVALLARRRRLALAFVLAWAVQRAVAAGLKAAVDRGRPPELLGDVVLRQHVPLDAGFPSAHSANAGALAVVVAATWPRWRWPAALGAVLVGVARLYVGVHLPLDLVGGWCLRYLGGTVAVSLATRLVPAPP